MIIVTVRWYMWLFHVINYFQCKVMDIPVACDNYCENKMVYVPVLCDNYCESNDEHDTYVHIS